jgi:hypothetical protein
MMSEWTEVSNPAYDPSFWIIVYLQDFRYAGAAKLSLCCTKQAL